MLNYPCYFLNGAFAIVPSISNDIELEPAATDYTPTNNNLSVIERIFDFLTRNRYVIVLRLYICILSYCFSGGLL